LWLVKKGGSQQKQKSLKPDGGGFSVTGRADALPSHSMKN
jgi:hypothetical protein